MKNTEAFVSLRLLVHSLDQPHRLYFLYRQTAAGGAPGAILRFEWMKQRLDPVQLKKAEILFEPARIRKAC